MSTPPRAQPATLWFVATVLTVIISIPALFVAFLFAYGFQDDISWGNHTSFLTAYFVITAVESLLAGVVVLAADRGLGRRHAMTFGALVAAGLNLLALGGGVWVSLTHEDEGSVTADQADGPFLVVLVVALVLGAASLVAAARTVPPRG